MSSVVENEKWKIRRDISVADLLSFASAALAVIYAYTTLDKRMAIVESALTDQKTVNKQHEEELIRVQARIDMRLDKMDEKLDRLIQRGNK
jgi:uncharacterized coiled-coil protein SlyX